jgi:hypothetical protein
VKPLLFACIALLCLSETYAQVNEIKSSSGKNSSGKSGSSSSDSDGDGSSLDGVFFFFKMFGEIHVSKLQDSGERYPSMTSFDIDIQGAIKPSSYYILQPRIRGNWGLFGTDFRISYLIEDDIEGYKHIRTNDWQILQLNVVTSKYVTFRLGTGYMQEKFVDNRYFSESAFMLNIHAQDQSKVLGLEFRFAKDWETDVTPRKEFNVQYQQQIFQASALHGYITLGGLFQQYYNTINVWGIQTGLAFRFF